MIKQNGKFLAEVIGVLDSKSLVLIDSERNLIYVSIRNLDILEIGMIVEVTAIKGRVVFLDALA